ncbi:hypothetical protein LR48_Vigan115s000500 [Vigna angularis]|uniref:Uncharacterized protein n=1 Tax=Phaseolus angularis TaxID=3914 RepID=A0A0L9T4L1_PHAAN|nr:hypothetical protein LR48_Vigan115s000500 [Vigna angularis]
MPLLHCHIWHASAASTSFSQIRIINIHVFIILRLHFAQASSRFSTLPIRVPSVSLEFGPIRAFESIFDLVLSSSFCHFPLRSSLWRKLRGVRVTSSVSPREFVHQVVFRAQFCN